MRISSRTPAVLTASTSASQVVSSGFTTCSAAPKPSPSTSPSFGQKPPSRSPLRSPQPGSRCRRPSWQPRPRLGVQRPLRWWRPQRWRRRGPGLGSVFCSVLSRTVIYLGTRGLDAVQAQQEPAGKPLLAPEPHLRVQTRDVGKLKEGGSEVCLLHSLSGLEICEFMTPEPCRKCLMSGCVPLPSCHLDLNWRLLCCMQELREFWGNKSSKGFAGPGLTGSRSGSHVRAGYCRMMFAVWLPAVFARRYLEL